MCHVPCCGKASLSATFQPWRLSASSPFAVDGPFAELLTNAFCCLCIREVFLKDIYNFTWSGDVKVFVCEKATLANALSTPVPKVTFNRAWLCKISKKKQFTSILVCGRLNMFKIRKAATGRFCTGSLVLLPTVCIWISPYNPLLQTPLISHSFSQWIVAAIAGQLITLGNVPSAEGLLLVISSCELVNSTWS